MTGHTPRRALVVEDAPAVRRLVADLLAGEGYVVDECGDGRESVEVARELNPELIVLDVGLPSLDGVEACRAIREFSTAYILILSGIDGEVDKVLGLSAGADDYVTKPFSPAELVARVRALQRRPRHGQPPEAARRRIGPLVVDVEARQVWLDGAAVDLTRTEFDLLETLSASPRRVFSRGQLLDRVWGQNWFGEAHLVDVHISNLRRKLGDDPRRPRFICTVRSVGYRLGTGESEGRRSDLLAAGAPLVGDLACLLALI